MESSDLVLTERDGHVLTITINKPQKRNAVDRELADLLDAAFNELDDDDELWCGILTGAGPAFSAGSDLNAAGDYYAERGGEYGIIRRERRTPLIAAVEGFALGGGLEIALACDLIVAGENARFGLPEVRRGLIASCAGLFRGPHALPLNIAMELAITGEPITAERAAHFGLVNRVVDDGAALDEARAMARVICANGPLAVALSRDVVRRTAGFNDPQGWELTTAAREAVYASADREEGIAAFFERREPRWTGK